MKMKKLNLPVVKRMLLAAKCLSMNDYMKFIFFNLKYTTDKKTVRKQKKLTAVNVPFLLK